MIVSYNTMSDTAPAESARQLLSETEEQALINRCVAGDWSEYGLLVRRYQRLAWAALDSATSDKGAIPDLLQDTFVRVYEKLHTYRADASFPSWLYRVARNIGLNHNRLLKRRPQHASLEDQAVEAEPLAGLAGPSPERSYRDSARQQALERMLVDLDEKYRLALNLHYASGLTYTEIATMLGLPPNTVRTRLKRGREQLLVMAQREGWK